MKGAQCGSSLGGSVHSVAAMAAAHNKDVIDQQMKEADEFVEQLKAASGPGPLARKLAATESGSDKVSR